MSDGDITDDWLQRHQRIQKKNTSKESSSFSLLRWQYWGRLSSAIKGYAAEERVLSFCYHCSLAKELQDISCVCVCVVFFLLPPVILHFNFMQMTTYFWLGRTSRLSRWLFHAPRTHVSSWRSGHVCLHIILGNSTSSVLSEAIPSVLVRNSNQIALLGIFSQVNLSTGRVGGAWGILSDGKTLMQSHTYEVPAETVKPSQLWSSVCNTG